MKNGTFVITSKLPWWFKGYVFMLACFCYTFGTAPDQDKLYKFVSKHIKWKVELKEVDE